MDRGMQTVSEGVVSYVARDGEVLAQRSAVPPLGSNDVRVAVELTTLGSWVMPTGAGIEPLGDTYVGRVVESGAAVDPSLVGTRVLGIMRSGGASTQLVAPSFGVQPCPESYSAALAASMTTSGLVACTLASAVDVAPGSVLAITSAGFGVSCVLAGLLRSRGARVVGIREHGTDHTPLIEAGCIAVLGPEQRPRDAALERATGGRLADLVIDAGRVASRWSDIEVLLAPTGRAVTWLAPARLDWDPKRSIALGVVPELTRQFAAGGDMIARLSEHILHLVDRVVVGELSLPVHEFPVERAQDAYDCLREPSTIGRVALRFTPGP